MVVFLCSEVCHGNTAARHSRNQIFAIFPPDSCVFPIKAPTHWQEPGPRRTPSSSPSAVETFTQVPLPQNLPLKSVCFSSTYNFPVTSSHPFTFIRHWGQAGYLASLLQSTLRSPRAYDARPHSVWWYHTAAVTLPAVFVDVSLTPKLTFMSLKSCMYRLISWKSVYTSTRAAQVKGSLRKLLPQPNAELGSILQARAQPGEHAFPHSSIYFTLNFISNL